MTDDLEELLLGTGRMAPDWRGAFRSVPREWFLPDVIWPYANGRSTAVDRRTSPSAWEAWAEANVPVTVQHDDGAASGPGVFTSSASMPSIVASMLRDLDAHPGMSVLEIGTGTGWNAALLSARLGDDHVTTVEVDSSLAAQARTRLHAAGYRPSVVTGDGLAGHPGGAPYDRIIATAGVRTVPRAWVAQARSGGVIVAPWGTDYSPQDAIARLIVADDGAAALGRFTGPAEFMKVRSQRLSWPEHGAYARDWPGTVSASDLTLEEVFDGSYGGTGMLLGLLVKGMTHTVHDGTAWLYGLGDRSWAAAIADGGRLRVHQSGPRRLWDEIEGAYRWWDDCGRPAVHRFGLTVYLDGTHTLWIDAPARLLPRTRAR